MTTDVVDRSMTTGTAVHAVARCAITCSRKHTILMHILVYIYHYHSQLDHDGTEPEMESMAFDTDVLGV